MTNYAAQLTKLRRQWQWCLNPQSAGQRFDPTDLFVLCGELLVYAPRRCTCWVCLGLDEDPYPDDEPDDEKDETPLSQDEVDEKRGCDYFHDEPNEGRWPLE